MNRKSSSFRAEDIANDSQNSIFNKENIYYCKIDNSTGFEVKITSPEMGAVKIPAGKSLIFPGHPEYPGNINFTTTFGPGHINTDKITITYILSHGLCSK